MTQQVPSPSSPRASTRLPSRPPSPALLRQLAALDAPLFFSIYLAPSKSATKQGVAIRRLRRQIEEQSAGMALQNRVLENVEPILERVPGFHADSIAIFVTPYRVWTLAPLPPVETQLHRGRHPYLVPLAEACDERRAFLLGVCLGGVSLQRLEAGSLVHVEVPELPEPFDAWSRGDSDPRYLGAHSTRQGQAQFHGQGAGEVQRRERQLSAYFRAIDDTVSRALPDGATVVLAGLPRWLSAYRRISQLPALHPLALEGDPSSMSDEARARALTGVLEESRQASRRAALARLEDARPEQRCVDAEAATHCRFAAAATLFVRRGAAFTVQGGTPARVEDDVVAMAIRDASATQTAIVVADHLPGDASLAALLRYRLPETALLATETYSA